MKNDLATICLIGCLGLGVLTSCTQTQIPKAEIFQAAFPNTLNLFGVPANLKDRSVFSMSDLGVWHSYSLSPKPSGGFVGPYLMTDDNGIWASKQLITLELSLGDNTLDWASAKMVSSQYLPGRLVQTYELEGMKVQQQLIYVSDRSTLVQYQIESSKKQPKVAARLKASTWLADWNFSINDSQLMLKSDSSNTQIMIAFDQPADGRIEANSFVGQEQEFDLNPGFPVEINYVQSAYFTESERHEDQELVSKSLSNPDWAFANNQKRWND